MIPKQTLYLTAFVKGLELLKVNVECNLTLLPGNRACTTLRRKNKQTVNPDLKNLKKGITGNAFPDIFMQCESYAGNSSQIVFGGNHYKCKIVYAKMFEIRLVEASVEGSFTKQVVIL